MWKFFRFDEKRELIIKSEIIIVFYSYFVNLYEDIKKGGWGGWKKEGYDNYL